MYSGFEIMHELPKDEMVSKYVANHSASRQAVLLKIIKPPLSIDESFRTYFFLLYKTLARIKTPYVEKIYDVGFYHNSDRIYVAAEHFCGLNLRDRIRRGLSLEKTLSIMADLCGGLYQCHHLNITHGHLNESLIQFKNEGCAVLTDFGFKGKQTADTRADLKSLGLLFQKMLHNQEYAEVFSPLVDRLLEKDDSVCFAHVKAFYDALRQRCDNHAIRVEFPELIAPQGGAVNDAATDERTGAKTTLPVPVPQPVSRTIPTPAAVIQRAGRGLLMRVLVIAVAAFTGIGIYLYKTPEQPPPVPPPQATAPPNPVAPKSAPSEDKASKLRPMLAQGHALLERNILITQGDNAIEAYRAVLKIDPQNREAAEKIKEIGNKVQQLAAFALQSGNYERARSLVDRGQHYFPDHYGIKLIAIDLKSQQEKQQIEDQVIRLTAKARQQIAAKKLLDPKGDNAYETIENALALSPYNQQIQETLQALAETALTDITHNLDKGRIDPAEYLLAQGLRISRKHAVLSSFRERFAREKQHLDNRLNTGKQIAALFKKAERQLDANRLSRPKGDNAVHSYRQILKLDPDNKQAKKALSQIAERIYSLAETRLRLGKLRESYALVKSGLTIAPRHAALRHMLKNIREEMAVAVPPKPARHAKAANVAKARPRITAANSDDMAESEPGATIMSLTPVQKPLPTTIDRGKPGKNRENDNGFSANPCRTTAARFTSTCD